MKEFEHILECLQLQKKGTAGDKQGIFDISNKERIGKSEVSFCWFIPMPSPRSPRRIERLDGPLYGKRTMTIL